MNNKYPQSNPKEYDGIFGVGVSSSSPPCFVIFLILGETFCYYFVSLAIDGDGGDDDVEEEEDALATIDISAEILRSALRLRRPYPKADPLLALAEASSVAFVQHFA